MKTGLKIILALLAVMAFFKTVTSLPNAGSAYVSCDPDHVYFSQDLILVSSPTTSDLFRATDTGWISTTTPMAWTQLRATPDKALYLYDENDGAFYHSEDLGNSWPFSATFPLASIWVKTKFYPSPISGTLFVGLNDYSIPGPGSRGAYKTIDNGGHWTNTDVGASGSDIVFSPHFIQDGVAFESYIIYHASGVDTTTDGGDSWTPADSGLYSSFIGVPYQLAISPDFSNDHTVFATANTGFYKTTNAGTSWSNLKSGDLFSDLSYYASLSPNYAIDQSVLLINREQKLELSQDGGATWRALPVPLNTSAQSAALRVMAPFELPAPTPPPAMPYHFYLPLINAVRIQPLEIWLIANDGIGCKLYRSSNFGETWQEEIVAETKH